ncbi:MAG: hypothetical protein CMG44_04160 [Candidatus Marinimicrobia bacterium]|nr:hypothetical protein [Candidatus Neomarinimicrobiota bacterium]
MNISFYLSLRHIQSKHKSGFVRTASLLSILGLSIGIAALLITLFILNGFERVISEKITEIDGHIRIKHFLNEPLNPSEYELDKKLLDNNSFSQGMFIQRPALLRKGQLAEGVIIEGMNSVDLNFIDKLLVEGSSDLSHKEVIVGQRLAELYKIKLNDKVTLFDLSTIYKNRKRFMQFSVKGIFNSGMTEFDKSSIYIKIEDAKNLFEMDEQISGYILRLKNVSDLDNINKLINSNISYPLMSMSWKEKNRALYKWLKVQRWPILFIFGLITLVAIVNIVSSLLMIIIDKTKQIGLLSAIGMPRRKIKEIFLIKGLIIGFFGTSIGSLIAVILAFLQNNYKIIGVPEDIYFMNFIPIDIDFKQILMISFISLIVSSLVSYWPSSRSSKIPPSEALKYE